MNPSNVTWQTFLQKTSKNIPSTILLHGTNLEYLLSHARQLAAHILENIKIYEEGTWSPDLYEHSPASKARVHLIDTPRAIQKTLWLEPFQGDRKVYLIHEVDRITLPAVSAFLKILEEPPAHSVFILTSTKKQQLPATILSRCFSLYLSPIHQDTCDEKQSLYIQLLCNFITGQTPISQVEEVLFNKSKEGGNKAEIQELARYIINLLGKILRDRYVFAHTQLMQNLYLDKYIKQIHILPVFPMEQVLFILDQAFWALNNSTTASACLQWVFLQLQSIKEQPLSC